MEGNVHEVIISCRRKIQSVAKLGRNDFHRYNYATINDVLSEVREVVNEAGLLIYCGEMRDFVSSKDGQVESFTAIYTVEAKDGTKIFVSVRCAGEDKGDKKAYKANTGALKYLFLQLFLMPTEDDPENDGGSRKKPWLNPGTEEWEKAKEYLAGEGTIENIKKKYSISKDNEADLTS